MHDLRTLDTTVLKTLLASTRMAQETALACAAQFAETIDQIYQELERRGEMTKPLESHT